MVNKEVKKEITWDVKIGDQIDFFDPLLSYELVKYRPITMLQGLDFDPMPFSKAAQNFNKLGFYIDPKRKGTKDYRDFWIEEKRRCEEGVGYGGYYITGDNYYFINYYRMLLTGGLKKSGAGRTEDFPLFLSKQYEFFHYVNLCEILGRDINALKSRGVGFSEVAASLAARMYSTTKNARVVCTAHSDKQLTPLMAKIWKQLNFLNKETELGHLTMVKKSESQMWKRASKLDADGVEYGHMAEIVGIIADMPTKLRGDRTDRLLIEEAGSNPHLISTYNQALALVEINGDRLGTRSTWGTGGDHGPALEGLSSIFNNPLEYNVLPFRSRYNDKQELALTGFFFPAYSQVFKFRDSRGVTNEIEARKMYEDERAKKTGNSKNLLEYKSEFCFTPEEALIRQGDNLFDQVLISDQLSNIDIHKSVTLPKYGSLVQKGKDNPINWVEDIRGKIAILEHPIKDEEGNAYNNLYVAGIDSIDIGTDDSATNKDVSDFCIVIKKRAFGIDEPKYVAMYKDRPKDVREAYDITVKMLEYYGCKAVLESTRTAIVTHFKNIGKIDLLMKRPHSTMANVASKTNATMYGAPATEKTIKHYIELINNFLTDNCHTIAFRDMLIDLNNYSYVNKRKYDIVAALGMAELGDEELSNKRPEVKDNISREFNNRDIGYYFDEYGIRRFGVIPSKMEREYKEQLNNDNRGTRDKYSWIYE